MDSIVVFSHLRWDFVFQRPQHLMSRLATGRRVIFFEEPIATEGEAFLETYDPIPNLTVCRPHTPAQAGGFHDEQLPFLKPLLARLVREQGLDEYVAWFYTPMALPLAQELAPRALIYDCMDELSGFLHAPRQLLQRETALLKCADLVFTGGPSLYRAKKDRHPRVHCFPSSVDAAHFARARDPEIEAAEQRALPRPRLGYFGVIDERLDLALLDAVAVARPDWQLVMVGPVVKIDPASLPRRPNIRYFGQQAYARLPEFLAGWDVCLLPFARNAATRYISPTKTLEYMAAARPIVSTPITDVAEPYGDVVYLGDTAAAFIAACERALSDPAEEADARPARMREVLASTSWDQTAAAMNALIIEAASRQAGVGAPDPIPAAILPRAPGAQSPRHRPDVVIGAGPTGLSAAYHLGAGSVLIDQNDRVGGWCRSVEDGGFTFDFAGHIMFSNDPYVHTLYERLLGDNVHWQDREAWIYSKNVYTRYPFQGSLYGLPADVIKECVLGAIEARFGPLQGDGAAATKPSCLKNVAKNAPAAKSLPAAPGAPSPKAASLLDCCADGIAETTAPLAEPGGAPGLRDGGPRNFKEFIYQVWGAGIAKHFAIPYNTKLWATPLEEMETSWLGGRVPQPDLAEMIEGALKPAPKPMGPNARFGYPLRGGFQALMDGFLPLLEGELLLGRRVVGVSPRQRRVTLDGGETLAYRTLTSTMPLPALVRLMGEEAPAAVREAASRLRHLSVRCVNLGVGRADLTDKHWIYYPEDTVFHRVFVQGNASPHCNAPGGTGITCEITYSPHKPLPCDDEALIARCVDDCRRVGLLRPDDPVWAANQVDMPYAYVIYDHARARNVELIRAWVAQYDIVLAGRYSEWEYYNSDHAFLAGRKAAERVREIAAREAHTGTAHPGVAHTGAAHTGLTETTGRERDGSVPLIAS